MRKVALIAVILAAVNVALAALPCNSRLRIIRPNLFKHCGNKCPYDQWSSWKTTGKAQSQKCQSKKAYIQTRTRHSSKNTCPVKPRPNTLVSICMHIYSYIVITICYASFNDFFAQLGYIASYTISLTVQLVGYAVQHYYLIMT